MTATIQHPAINSPVFELTKTVEFDIQIGDESFSLRFELLCDTTNAQCFRVHVWRLESYRIQPVFAQDKIANESKPKTADETIFVDTAFWLSKNYDGFCAPSPDKAMQIVLDDFRQFLARTLGNDKVETKT